MKNKNLKKDLVKIYDAQIRHRSFLEENHILKCMMEAYKLGYDRKEKSSKVGKLKRRKKNRFVKKNPSFFSKIFGFFSVKM
jgi:transcription initiation factor TFIID subunit TAF12